VSYQDFDAKLRMTAAVLGCTSRKELVGHFHRVNKSSQCTLDRLHKWLQGRSLPRSAEILQEWASILGSQREGSWLAGCSLAEFAGELAARFGRDAGELMGSEAFAGRGTRTAQPAGAAEPRMSGVRYLCGSYACYSQSWSPYARGQLIRGSLVIAPGQRDGLTATYSESLMNHTVRLTGSPIIAQRSIFMTLIEPGGEIPIFFSLFLPRPPASILTGILAGATFVSPEPEPSASRIVMIRVPPSGALDATNRYLVPARGIIAADLADLRLLPQAPDQVDDLVQRFLLQDSTIDRAELSIQSDLATHLDPCHLAPRGSAANDDRPDGGRSSSPGHA
jgi:hypothetical protein